MVSFKMSAYEQLLATSLKQQVNEGKYCDIEIFVEDKQFNGHKCILAALSPLLEKHIENAEKDYYDTSMPHKSKIELSGISATGFSALFEYMYSGKLDINDENANEVTIAAMILEIKPAIQESVEYKQKQFVANSLPVNRPLRPRIMDTPSTYIEHPDDTATMDVSHSNSDQQPTSSVEGLQITSVISTSPSTSLSRLEPETQQSVSFQSSSSAPDMYDSILQSFEAMKNDPLALPTLLSFKQSPHTSSQMQQSTSPEHAPFVKEMIPQTVYHDDDMYCEEIDDNGEQIWRCKMCNKLFRKLSYLKYVHVRLHNGNRPFVCNLCGKQFATKGNLLQHHKVHLAKNGILPHKCKHCKRAFALKGNCQKHEKTHTKPYRCEYCPRSFALKHDCLQHHRKHHSGADHATIGLKCEKCLSLFPERFGKDYMVHQCPNPKL